jgi:hypothetical protein
MWSNLKEALVEGRLSIPDSDSLHADLCSVGYKYRSDGCLLLESKQDLRKRACQALTKLIRWRYALPAQSAHRPSLV